MLSFLHCSICRLRSCVRMSVGGSDFYCLDTYQLERCWAKRSITLSCLYSGTKFNVICLNNSLKGPSTSINLLSHPPPHILRLHPSYHRRVHRPSFAGEDALPPVELRFHPRTERWPLARPQPSLCDKGKRDSFGLRVWSSGCNLVG